MKLHCNDCGNSYDTILPLDEIDIAVCPRCGSFGSSVPVTETVPETQEEPVTPPPHDAPVANPRPVEIQPEVPRKTREGQQCTPPSENATGGNVEGRFFSRVSKKGLFIAAGILILLIVAGITWTIVNRGPGASGGDVDVVIERENPQAPEEKKAEEKQAEQQAPAPAPEKPAPAHQERKTVKKAPAKTPTPKASTPSSNTPWRYRVETTPAPTPAPKQPRAQASKNPLGKLLDVFQGPAPDVTPAPAPNDARGSGM